MQCHSSQIIVPMVCTAGWLWFSTILLVSQRKFSPVSNNSQQDQCDALYGVQPGETYTVEIIPFNHVASFSAVTATTTIPTTALACTVTRRPITNTPTPSTVTSEYINTSRLI